MPRSIWGLDIGEWSLKVARGSVEKATGEIVVDLYDTIPYCELPCGTEADALVRFREGLGEFAERYVIGKKDRLCVAVSGSEVFSRFINLPPVPERLSEIIRYEARQQIPFDIDRVVWDFQPIKEEYEIGEEIEVGLFALKEERISEFLEMLGPWERNLAVIQDSPLAVYNFLRYEGWVEEPLVVLDVGAHTTDVLILNHPRFWIRPVLIGGNDLTNALVEKFGISFEEAERVKQRAAGSPHEAQIQRVIAPVVQNIISEVQRSVGYYKGLARGVRFERVLAIGNTFKMSGLAKFINKGLQYEVQKLDKLRNIRLAPSVDKNKFRKELGGACAALGLLVQGAEQGHMKINLMPGELAVAATVRKKRAWVAGVVAGLFLIAFLLIASEQIYGEKLAKVKNKGVPELAKINNIENAYREAESEADSIKKRLDSLTGRGVDRDLFLRLVPLLASALPEEVYLKELALVWNEPSEMKFTRAFARRTADQRALSRARPRRGRGRRSDALEPTLATPGMPPGSPGDPGMQDMPGSPVSFGTRQSSTLARKSSDARLVMFFYCEWRTDAGGKTYIDENVLRPLEKLTSPDTGEAVFEEVGLLEEPKDIHRNYFTGAEVSAAASVGLEGGTPRPASPRRGQLLEPGTVTPAPASAREGFRREKLGIKKETIHFVYFSGYAVVNTGETPQKGPQPPEETGTP